jgi:hypothetical protein
VWQKGEFVAELLELRGPESVDENNEDAPFARHSHHFFRGAFAYAPLVTENKIIKLKCLPRIGKSRASPNGTVRPRLKSAFEMHPWARGMDFQPSAMKATPVRERLVRRSSLIDADAPLSPEPWRTLNMCSKRRGQGAELWRRAASKTV